jgi:hypothetical protein
MGEDHDDRVHSGGLPTTTVLKYCPCCHSGEVKLKEVQGTGMASPIESSQGESKGWQPLSPCPTWTAVGVIYSHMTVVTPWPPLYKVAQGALARGWTLDSF